MFLYDGGTRRGPLDLEWALEDLLTTREFTVAHVISRGLDVCGMGGGTLHVSTMTLGERYCKRSGLVAGTCAYTRANDRSSRVGYRSILVLMSLANQDT